MTDAMRRNAELKRDVTKLLTIDLRPEKVGERIERLADEALREKAPPPLKR
jgi:hypothetical protein